MKIFLKIIIPVLVFVLLALFIAYLIESRFFTVGKAVFPAYMVLDRTADFLDGKGAKAEDTIVYCDYYTWHNQDHWERGYSNIPLLGFYDSLDPDIINTHIKWAQEYGIDVLKIEYIPQFDSTITEGVLKSDIGDTKLCLMYDSRLRFESIGYPAPPYDFNDEKIAKTFLDDMAHIAKLYFESSNYFRINDRPILWIYVSRRGPLRVPDIVGAASPFVLGSHLALALLWLTRDQLHSHQPLAALLAAAITSYAVVAAVAFLFPAGRETLQEGFKLLRTGFFFTITRATYE